MSNFAVEVVKIKGAGKHPNADSLSITQVYSYPIIFRTDEFQIGDFTVFFPEESIVPQHNIFSFLWKDKEPTEKNRRIRALRLRGIFSCGLLVPLSKLIEAGLLPNKEYKEGDNLTKDLGVTKYEPQEQVITDGDNEARPSWFVEYTDIENLRKHNNVLIPGEECVFTTKIHGTNARYCYKDGRLWIGSHHNCKKADGKNIYHKIAEKYNLIDKLRYHENFILFGEIYGGVQKGFCYDAEGINKFRAFDVYDLNNNKYLDWLEFLDFCNTINIDIVPILWCGPWENIEKHNRLLEGKEPLSQGKHCREGYVVRPLKERYDLTIGRVILKYISEEYLLQK